MMRFVAELVVSLVFFSTRRRRCRLFFFMAWMLCIGSANANTYYVSPAGNDAGLGTLADPLETMSQACSQVQPGDTVFLREGEYLEALTPATSGTAASPITFSSYANENVVLVSGQLISGWIDLGDGVYKATSSVDLGPGLNQLICNGDLMIDARYPNVNSKEDLAFVFKKKNILPAYFHQQSKSYDVTDTVEIYEGGEHAQTAGLAWYVGLHNQSWGTQIARFQYVSPGTLRISYKSQSQCFFGLGGGYVVGAVEYLDHPKEWFLDADADEIYFIPPTGVNPNSETVYLKDRHDAIDLSDRQYIVVDGLNTWMGSVKMVDSQDCVVRNSSHLYGGQHTFVDNIYGNQRDTQNTAWYSTGFFVSGSNNCIEHCEVAYNAGASVMMTGQDHEVVNCRIHDSGLLGNYASGIFFVNGYNYSEQLGGHEIASNTIYNVGRSAIHISSDGGWGTPGVYANPLSIHHNELANAMLIAEDGGAIYDFVTDGSGTEIAYNVIHDTGSSGIYMDNYARGFDIHHNVLYRIDGNHIRVSSPGNERVNVFNNTIIDPGFFPNNAFAGCYEALVCDNLATTWGIHPKEVDFVGTGEGGAKFQPLDARQVPQSYCEGPGQELHTHLSYSGAYAAVGVETAWQAGADWGGRIPPIQEVNQQLWACDYSRASGFRNNAGYVVSQAASAWLSYADVDFGQGYSQLLFRAIVDSQSAGGTVELRTGSSTGTLIGSTSLTANSDGNVFEYRCIELGSVQGLQDLYLVCSGTSGALLMDMVLIGPQGKMSQLLPAENGGRLLNVRESTFKKGMWWQDNKIRRTVPGDWIYFPKVDFGRLSNKALVTLSLANGAEGGVIEVRSGSPTGPLLGQHAVTGTGDALGDRYEAQEFELDNVSGVHDLFMVFKYAECGNISSISWMPLAAVFTGGDVGEGLDLSGDFAYAVNVAGDPLAVQGLTFTADGSTAGFTSTTSTGDEGNTGTHPSYGVTSDDVSLATLMHATALASGTDPWVELSMDVTAGTEYELQLLFSENAYTTANARHFDIAVEGVTIVDEFTPIPAGAEWAPAPHTGVLVTYRFVAGDSVVIVDLTQGSSGDVNPLIQAVTLKDLTPPPDLATIAVFTGGDLGEGIDLSGETVYAVNVAGAEVSLQGLTFTTDASTPGFTSTSSTGYEANWGTKPSYGATADDDMLETMMNATCLAYSDGSFIDLDMDVTVGLTYELHLFFSENSYKTAGARKFDVAVEGVKIVDEFTPSPSGTEWTTAPNTGVLVTYRFVAGDCVVNVDLTQGSSGDMNPVLQGVILKDISPITLWDNDMSVDPVGDGWVVRGIAARYSVSNGVLTMGEGAYSTLLDTATDQDFLGVTTIDLRWRATSSVAGKGAGLWCNVNNDTDTYGAIRFESSLDGAGSQTLTITAPGQATSIAGFSTNWLALHAQIDSDAQTITYQVTDGTTSASDTVFYTQTTVVNQQKSFTLYTEGPRAEVTSVRIEANATLETISYATWASDYGLSGSDTNLTADVEPDGLDNLMEYALGGNPTVNDALAIAPVTFMGADGNWFYYVHRQRTDDPSLTYTLGTATVLTGPPSWNTNDVVTVGQSAGVNGFKAVTNRTELIDGAKFIRLNVEP